MGLPGTYDVRSKARCATDVTVESDWSDPLSVVVSDITYTAVTLLAQMEVMPFLRGDLHRAMGSSSRGDQFQGDVFHG